jgi:phosphoribosylaminoimidazole-succinocarboxamide synthase
MIVPVLETHLSGVPAPRRGKVRDVYDVGQDLLIVATDRISAFDYILASGIPDKGKVLNQLSAFWFGVMEGLVPHHVLTTDADTFPAPLRGQADLLRGRSMLVRKTRPLAIECVVRGYLSGSGWKEYQKSGSVCGIPLPAGLKESDRLPRPIFTPSTKAESGHDINITEAEAAAIVGPDVAGRVRDLSIEIYSRGAEHALGCGIILADTKFEFGLVTGPDGGDQIILIDEVLTPDSSRFWPAAQYAPGGPQPSYDKQFVRDHLEAIGWNKQPPAPSLPDEVIAKTREKYVEAHRLLTGRELQ